MSDDIKGKVIDAIKMFQKNNRDNETISKPKAKRKAAPTTITQSAVGNGIVQAGGNISGNINVTIKPTTKRQNITIQPPVGTIGGDAELVTRITGLFNELGLRREGRFGKSAYSVMYNEFKKFFGIPKNQKYTSYLLWPQSRAIEIITYLEGKLSNTIKGRIQNSAKTKGHSSQHLLAETRRLHDMLGWEEQDYRTHLHNLFGVISRADLNQSQLANYVAYLRRQIDEQH